jgi:radical SAM superfamily enzyme YgiQ (UPF0313 family)
MILINPPSPFLDNERVFPNLGIMQLASAWKRRGIEVYVFDLNGQKDWKQQAKDVAMADDIFGMTSTSPQFKYTYEINKIIKKNNQEAKTIIGGPHASAISFLKQKGISDINIKSLEEFDQIICGDGEDWKNGDKWQMYHNKSISDIPVADRSFMNIKSYHYYLNGIETTNMLTQRGCAFKCTFCCGRDMEMYNKVRHRKPEDVLEEMDYLNQRYGYKSFMWYDDEINLNTGRLKALCNLLKERDYQHRGFIRTDLLVRNPEMARELKEAGFVKICAGIETGSDRMLQAINKQTTVAMNYEARQICKDEGLHFEAFMMLGHPGETLEDIDMTKQWIKTTKPDDFDIGLTTPYPGSLTYDNAKWNGHEWDFNGLLFDKPDYSKEDTFYKGKNAQSRSSIRTKTITNDQYLKIRDEIERYKCT